MPTTGSSFHKAVEWIKENPVYSLVVAMTPVVGLIATLPGAVSSVNDLLGLPKCWTYSKVYYYADGHFRNLGDKWVEFQSTTKYNFEEQARDKEFIKLLNKSERVGTLGWEIMEVKLPVCGGYALITIERPERWRRLIEVNRDVSAQMALSQQEYEQR